MLAAFICGGKCQLWGDEFETPNFRVGSFCRALHSDPDQSDNKLAGNLGIADTVGRGLLPYTTSDDCFGDMRTAHIPHPFDSHSPLQQRMQQVGHVVPPEGYGAVVTQVPTRTWANRKTVSMPR